MDAEVLFERRGHAAIITLNRSGALNAVTLNMVRLMSAQLKAWAGDDTIAHVVVQAAGGKAFSAGGDIRALYDWGLAGDKTFLDFYREEYLLNTLIKRYPKPYIALMDGIAMGGGVGVSVNGSHRVVTDRLTFAMPETGIGLFPDVGATYFLPRCPGETGVWLGLTGGRLKAADALYLGIATQYTPSHALPDVLEALCAASDAQSCLDKFAESPGAAPIQAFEIEINRHFSKATVEAVLAGLDAAGDEWAAQQAKIIRTKSPASLKITLRQLREGRALDFEACMRLEYRIVNRIFSAHDFFEGTRAVVIDKDNAPQWQPASLDQVSGEAVQAYFDPLEVELPV